MPLPEWMKDDFKWYVNPLSGDNKDFLDKIWRQQAKAQSYILKQYGFKTFEYHINEVNLSNNRPCARYVVAKK